MYRVDKPIYGYNGKLFSTRRGAARYQAKCEMNAELWDLVDKERESNWQRADKEGVDAVFANGGASDDSKVIRARIFKEKYGSGYSAVRRGYDYNGCWDETMSPGTTPWAKEVTRRAKEILLRFDTKPEEVTA